MSVTFDYRGKFVFVAGGTSGINLGVAHAFARCGARIAVLSRSQDKVDRSEEHTSELQSLMRISYAVFCLKKKKHKQNNIHHEVTKRNITRHKEQKNRTYLL